MLECGLGRQSLLVARQSFLDDAVSIFVDSLGDFFACVGIDQQRACGKCSEVDAEDKSSRFATSAARGFHEVVVFQINRHWQS